VGVLHRDCETDGAGEPDLADLFQRENVRVSIEEVERYERECWG